jgi:archaellum component FlaC
LKKLTGNRDIEDSLDKLDKLTQEEARMASAEQLKMTHSVDGKVTGVDDRVRGVEEMVQDVRGDVRDVGDKVQDIDGKLDRANRSSSR